MACSKYDTTSIYAPVPRLPGLSFGIERFTVSNRSFTLLPLHDVMNLVAKEFVAAQRQEDPGALVLSRFAGAAQELTRAILVNPYDPDEIAEGLHLALTMPFAERLERWQAMREVVWRNTAVAWSNRFLAELAHTASHSPGSVQQPSAVAATAGSGA